MGDAGDPIGQAIVAAEAPARRTSGQMKLSSGRVIAIEMPIDLTDAEFLEAIVVLVAQVRPTVRAKAGPHRRILVPAGVRLE